ncbi:MAG: ribonuclease H-like domain-containing protein [Methanobacteriota archaeon]|nr:MAG: ribonuclease H-like domain-containing protein [Euryarchaeota archaeon]
MLVNSFVFLEGVGVARERALWQAGIVTWDRFMEEDRITGMSADKKAKADGILDDARQRLRKGDCQYFSAMIKTKDHWRCFEEFRNRVIYLDIETTGISKSAPITMIGMYDGRRMHTLVRGQNLTNDNLRAILEHAGMIVSFNGASFDLPVIESAFPGAVPPVPHLDLKHLLRRLGRVGGLKAIEREMGVDRDLRIQYLTGQDAAYLWRLWRRRGAWNALETLKEYNSQDCINLETIAEAACMEMKSRVMGPALSDTKLR